MQSEDHRRTALQYPLVHWILCRCQQYGAFEHEGLRKQNDVLGLCPVEGRAYRRLRVTDVDEYTEDGCRYHYLCGRSAHGTLYLLYRIHWLAAAYTSVTEWLSELGGEGHRCRYR